MIKRIFDFSSSFIGLIILLPLLIFISFAIKLGSSGPVLFSQKRVGKDGKLFTLIKFRSMSVYQESRSTATARGDARITGVGSFLRKYKLDELPELWNVLKGEMSLVGPRPDVPGYADSLKGTDRNMLKLRPGITGTASLKYANEEELLASQENPQKYNDEVIFPDKVKVNLEYYENQSLWLDIKIIFATIFRTSY
ncbi:MAG: sugar transferase [Flavobacteriales bacterium]|jgi:lipopolysaccharide/colanic/teichoic acid biosynthesis glycosyltransferase|nr:sugar transferase [Flavobacteriales bacterium]MBT6014220.1 sugar transferase [Flavobacteriales bacterium]